MTMNSRMNIESGLKRVGSLNWLSKKRIIPRSADPQILSIEVASRRRQPALGRSVCLLMIVRGITGWRNLGGSTAMSDGATVTQALLPVSPPWPRWPCLFGGGSLTASTRTYGAIMQGALRGFILEDNDGRFRRTCGESTGGGSDGIDGN